MKPARRLLPLPLACLAASLFCPLAALRAQEPPTTARAASVAPTPAPAPADPARQAAAKELLKAMKVESLFDTSTERMTSTLDQITDGAARRLGNKPEVAEFQTRMHAESRELVKKEFTWESLEPQFCQAYEEAYTTPELKELTAFYNSPVGQKLIAKQPEISKKLGEASQTRARAVFPLIVKKIQDEAGKLQASLATPAPSPAAGEPSAAMPPGAVPAAKGTPPKPQ